MPLNIDIVQVLLHMLNFVLLAGGLTLILFNPVRRFMDERRRAFEEREAENRKNAQENERLKAEYEAKLLALQEETAAARRQAEKDAKAEDDAEKRKEQILDSAQTEIGELVIGATQKLLGETATPERTQALYDAFLDQAEKKAARKEKHV